MSKTILLIDSDENFAQGLQAAILASGFNAVVATDSEQGMTLAREENPDLIVVCVEAQPTNGYMLCTRLKKDDQLKGIPVILTSTNATEESFEKHRKLKTRAEEYLIKPFAPALLLRKASELLGVAPPFKGTGDEPFEDEIVSMEDEPLGLGDLVADEDEPIQLSDSEAAAAHEPEAEVLEESVEVEIEEEQPQTQGRAQPQHDEDLQLFDRAFDAIGMPGEEPAAAPQKAPLSRPRPPPPRAVPSPRLAERDDDDLALAALDALGESPQVLEEPLQQAPAARPSAPRGVQPAPKARGGSLDEGPRRGADLEAGPQARKAEKEILRLKEDLEDAKQRADTLAAAAKKLDRELSQLREKLDAVTGEKELLSEEREELRQRLASAEAEATRNEERAVKAYQKMKGDERLREKTRKALQVALQLLEEGTGASESRETAVPEKQSA
ncbi:MAG TPA: response regulator [Myxococcales bacterium]|nr:response regulator [Myxococcales bacterium]